MKRCELCVHYQEAKFSRFQQSFGVCSAPTPEWVKPPMVRPQVVWPYEGASCQVFEYDIAKPGETGGSAP